MSDTAAISIDQFCVQFNLGRTSAYKEIAAGRLKARKIGSRTVLLADDVKAWRDALPSMETHRASA